jgi:hypothetical protein
MLFGLAGTQDVSSSAMIEGTNHTGLSAHVCIVRVSWIVL